MKLSIITINFNNLEGLKNTFNSIFSQTNNDFEYIVIDGSSTDGSKELIEERSNEISYWVSEPDNGIYHAMNKGIKYANGEYLLFINSGDTLFNNETINLAIPELKNHDIIYGDIVANYEKTNVDQIVSLKNETIDINFFYRRPIPHQSTFIKSFIAKKYPYNEEYKIISDWEFFFYQIILKKRKIYHLNQIISIFDTTGLSSQPENLEIIKQELDLIYEKHIPGILSLLKENNDLKLRLKKMPYLRFIRFLIRFKKQFKIIKNRLN